MARTTNPKPARATKPAAPAKDTQAEKKTERITAFNSHGARFYRMTLPREWAAQYENALNRWECEIAADGTVTFKPVSKLVKVS